MIEDDTDKKIKTTLKIYPYIGKTNNRKGYYVGDLKTVVNTDELPFTNFDQVDHMLYNLFGYVKNGKNPRDFFIVHPENIEFIPTKLQQMGGRHRKTMKKTKKTRKTRINKKSKKNKRKTYKR
jgi:hypothetical protein